MKDDNFILTDEWTLEAEHGVSIDTFVRKINVLKTTHDIKFLELQSEWVGGGNGYQRVTYIIAMRKKS